MSVGVGKIHHRNEFEIYRGTPNTTLYGAVRTVENTVLSVFYSAPCTNMSCVRGCKCFLVSIALFSSWKFSQPRGSSWVTGFLSQFIYYVLRDCLPNPTRNLQSAYLVCKLCERTIHVCKPKLIGLRRVSLHIDLQRIEPNVLLTLTGGLTTQPSAVQKCGTF